MVINIPKELIAQIKDVQIEKIIKLLFSYFELEKHDWFISTDDNIKLFEVDSLKSYETFIKKQVVHSTLYGAKDFDERIIVQVYPSVEELRDLVENKIKILKDVKIIEYLNGNRFRVSTQGKTYELITKNIVESFLAQPLKIILENVESDRLFIETCLLALTGRKVDDLWIEFVHGGGSDLVKVAESFQGKYRVVCIIDSDIISPPNIYNTPSKPRSINKIKRTTETMGYSLHILNKREMENYLPDNALKKYLNNEGKASDHLYFLLPEECKDYFDMKKGLKPNHFDLPVWSQFKEKNIDESNETAVAIQEQSIGIDGFGDYVWKAFVNVENTDELLSRDDKNEIKEIVEKITSLI